VSKMAKKFKVNNIKVGYKMFFVLIVPIVAIIIATIISVMSVRNVSESLINELYNKTNKSMALMLNSDRDFYQALTDQINMQKATNQEDIKKI